MTNTLQLNNTLLSQLSNVVMLYNAAAGFRGKHLAVVNCLDHYGLDLAERRTNIITDCDGTYVEEDMDCYIIHEFSDQAGLIEAIRLVVDMTIELAL